MAELNLRALLSTQITLADNFVYGTEPPGPGWVYEGELAWSLPANCQQPANPPLHLIEVPDIRQPDAWSCGACAAMCVGRYFGVGPRRLEGWKKALGTSLQQSTHPHAIAAYLQALGLEVEAQDNLSILDLYLYWQKGMPVICPVQDYGSRREKGADFAYGHYLTVIGTAFGYVFCQDSSEDNVVEIPDPDSSIQAPGKVMIHEEEFLREWHDRDVDDNEFWHYGIAVGQAPRQGA